MLSIQIIKINLVFLKRISLTLFIDSSLLDYIMSPIRKEVKGVLRRAMNNKSQSSHQIKLIFICQSPT